MDSQREYCALEAVQAIIVSEELKKLISILKGHRLSKSQSKLAKQCWLNTYFIIRRTLAVKTNSNLNSPAILRTQRHN